MWSISQKEMSGPREGGLRAHAVLTSVRVQGGSTSQLTVCTTLILKSYKNICLVKYTQKFSKSNSLIYTKEKCMMIKWGYPRNARLVWHWDIDHCNSTNYQTKNLKKEKTTIISTNSQKVSDKMAIVFLVQTLCKLSMPSTWWAVAMTIRIY